MNALIVTEEQAAQLEAANGNSIRRLKPRRLSDGRLILNADVLTDPFFADRSRGWAAVLLAPVEQPPPGQTEGTEFSPEIDLEAGGVSAPVEVAAGVQRATLSAQELAE